jgi:hypothetical protein
LDSFIVGGGNKKRKDIVANKEIKVHKKNKNIKEKEGNC